MSDLVTIIQMVNIGGVEIDGLFHEAQAEDSRVEIHVLLRIAREGCDVMYPLYSCGHGSEIHS